MTDPRAHPRSSPRLAPPVLSPVTQALSSSVRPRTRRIAGQGRGSSLLKASASRSASPRAGSSHYANSATTGSLGQFLGESWSQSWSSVQGLATSLLSSDRGRDITWQQPRSGSQRPKSSPGSWGPDPPQQSGPLTGAASCSLTAREAALKTARTASVLESHDGVNGGLDIAGVYKRRLSDDDKIWDTTPSEDCLVYIHPVEPDDTYAGIILRYQCQEDLFRKSNGLWCRDSIQTRKRLVIPVDACQARSRPCEAPPWHISNGMDAEEQSQKVLQNGSWSHVSWVQIDSMSRPVQICRVSRHALGYFPPRRKTGQRSIGTLSSLSTPRQSSELASIQSNPSNGQPPSPRQSSFRSRGFNSRTPVSARSRVGSDAGDQMPRILRRPGGVGTMGSNVRTPGPDGDYLNSWTRKHLPSLTIAGLPSMSVMGSETARFGFDAESTGIVESSFEEGRDILSVSRQGNSLDRAAAAVENWLRGALSGRPSTPSIGSRARSDSQEAEGDLIELTDTTSKEARIPTRETFSPLVVTTSSIPDNSDYYDTLRASR